MTMMRGAQSGGVVTFEPTKYSNKHRQDSSSCSSQLPPLLKGVRSRIVNAKRTDLSKILKHKLITDNCSPLTGNLRGYNSSEYTINEGGGKLVRGFFGHTRFATSSKSSFEGTHPHQWSKRTEHKLYSFGSAAFTATSASHKGSGSSGRSSVNSVGRSHVHGNSRNNNVAVEPRSVGVENYVTHNGDFEFFRVKDKYYDVVVVQAWLEKVLETPMPATVDSGEYMYVLFSMCSVCQNLESPSSSWLEISYYLDYTSSSTCYV